jgi:hypothetical protein
MTANYTQFLRTVGETNDQNQTDGLERVQKSHSKSLRTTHCAQGNVGIYGRRGAGVEAGDSAVDLCFRLAVGSLSAFANHQIIGICHIAMEMTCFTWKCVWTIGKTQYTYSTVKDKHTKFNSRIWNGFQQRGKSFGRCFENEYEARFL